jgi:outer membrane protein W
MKRGLIVLSVLSLLVGGVATASVQKGDTELDAMFSFVTENGATDVSDFEAWSLSASLGYFITDNIRLGIGGMWTSMDGTEGVLLLPQSIDIWGIGGSVKYHFMPTNQWVPYIGAQIYWANLQVDFPGDVPDLDADGVLWGPVAGLRYELNANNDFFVEYQYHIWDGDIGDGYDDGHAVFLGISHQFK